MSDRRFPATALHALALVASIRTALGVRRSIDARRAGHDASAQEDEQPVRAYLADALERIGSLLVRLQLRVVAGPLDDPHAALVQTFEDRIALSDLADELRVAHQKLLSLYPDVSEALIEAVRLAHQDGLALIEADDLDTVLGPFLERLVDARDALRESLGGGR